MFDTDEVEWAESVKQNLEKKKSVLEKEEKMYVCRVPIVGM
jgi:hypothetical protein